MSVTVDVVDGSCQLVVEIEDLEGVVARCRGGDLDAWSVVVRRFQAVAQTVAWSRTGDWSEAADASQEAFLLAYRHLGALEDPAAFPGWFSQLVRTACDRQTRRRRLPTSELDAGSAASGPASEDVDVAFELQRLHRAIEALPEHERAVIALHYLAELTYGEVASFLGISTSAAKKRALSGRARLKDILPMTPDTLRTKPGRDISDEVLLFLSIRQRDRARVAALLARKPTLVHATEQWTWGEALDLGLQNAEHGTPLIRAVQTGDVELVRLIIEAGASVRHACECDGGESALWTAALLGNQAMVDYLLSAGADPNAAAFAGSTPLHVATQRGHHDIVERLVAAGANAEARDTGGRTAADWAALERQPLRDGLEPAFLPTGIRAIDLFAPLRRGDIQYWPPAAELGQFATLWAIVGALDAVDLWVVGFETGPYDQTGITQSLAQTAIAGTVDLAPRQLDAPARRSHTDAVLQRLVASPNDKLVVVLAAPEHHHDVTVALATITASPHVVATFVVEPHTHFNEPPQSVPEGFDAQVAFDARRGFAGLWPAVDGRATLARRYPDEVHAERARAARVLLARYDTVDPDLRRVHDGAESGDTDAARGARLHRYLAQPFRRWEYATGQPGELTTVDELLDDIAHILGA